MPNKTLRELHRAAIQSGLIGVLDVGTSKIVSLTLRVKGFNELHGGDDVGTLMGTDSIRLLGAATTRSRGVTSGTIENPAGTERAIRTALTAASKMALEKVGYVLVCSSDPDTRNFDTLKMIVERCDLKLAGFACSAHASAMSCLTNDEHISGATCIDMGGGSIGVSVFEGERLIFSETLRKGGNDVTAEISKRLLVPFSTAERIKTFYGGAVATGLDEREMIEIDGDADHQEHVQRTVSRSELIAIVRPLIAEMLGEVRQLLNRAGFEHLPV